MFGFRSQESFVLVFSGGHLSYWGFDCFVPLFASVLLNMAEFNSFLLRFQSPWLSWSALVSFQSKAFTTGSAYELTHLWSVMASEFVLLSRHWLMAQANHRKYFLCLSSPHPQSDKAWINLWLNKVSRFPPVSVFSLGCGLTRHEMPGRLWHLLKQSLSLFVLICEAPTVMVEVWLICGSSFVFWVAFSFYLWSRRDCFKCLPEQVKFPFKKMSSENGSNMQPSYKLSFLWRWECQSLVQTSGLLLCCTKLNMLLVTTCSLIYR